MTQEKLDLLVRISPILASVAVKSERWHKDHPELAPRMRKYMDDKMRKYLSRAKEEE